MNSAQENRPLILVTGSSGLIGTRLMKALVGDYRVVGLDVKPPDETIEGTAMVECDMTDDVDVQRALGEVRSAHGDRVASVIHLAAYYDFSGEPSPLYDELTVEGTRRLLRNLQAFEVEQFVFSSTLLMMKPSEEEPLTEDSPVQAEWDSPQSKLETEAVIRQERGAIPAVLLRIAGVYDEQCHSIPIGQQISRIHQKQLEGYFFPGDSSHGQSFVHLDDLIDCFCKTIERRHALGPEEVFLIGEEDVMSYEELQEEIGTLLHGSEWPAIRIPKVAAKTGAWVKGKVGGDEFIKPWMIDLADQNYPVRVQRAREKLGWHPRHLLRDTLREMIEHLQRDPQGWYELNGLPVPETVQKE